MDRGESTPVTVLKTVSLNVQDDHLNAGESAKAKDGEEEDDLNEVKIYPFASVLRIRVLQKLETIAEFLRHQAFLEFSLISRDGSNSSCRRSGRVQIKEYSAETVARAFGIFCIVCGISSMVMGTVGLIEEKGELNLGLSIPAGAVTIIAAGASIHTSRGFGGYKPSSCAPRSILSHFRFLGPSVSVAGLLTLAWVSAFVLHASLCVLSCRTLAKEQWITVYHHRFLDPDARKDFSETADDDWNARAIAAIILILSVITILSTLILLRIDCLYDPD